MTSRTSDAIVVGAGIIGASMARGLADRGARVSLVEAKRPSGGTSLGTFAWVNAVGKTPRAYFDLNVAGMAEHARLAAELGPGDWYHAGGNLEWSSPGDELEAKIDHHRGWGYAVERIDVGELRELEPDLAVDDRAVAALYPDDTWIDPAPLVGRLIDHPRIDLTAPATVSEIAISGGRVEGVRLADGRRLAADTVVISAGPQCADLAESVGFELPMRHAPGLLVITEPAPVRLSHVLHTPGLAVRPEGGGRLMLASDGIDRQIEPSGGSMPVDDASAELLRRAVSVLPRLAGLGIEAARIGLRALTADGKPAIGELPGGEGAYLAVAHSGITLAPLIGRLAAAELRGDEPDPRFDDYRPTRFIADPQSG